MKRFLLIATIALPALSGCTAPEPRQAPLSPASETAFETLASVESATILHSLDDSQVVSFWTDAEIARREKRYADASFHVESALRIIPDDPVLWSRLAELRMQLGEHALAENYAAKSNALALDNRPLTYRNWLIIQYARDRRGDVLGAREAQVEVRKYAPK